MRKQSTILSDTIILTVVNIILRLISLSFQAYLSKAIGAEGIGLLQLVYNAGAFAMTLGLSGIRTASMYLCAEQFGKNNYSAVRSTVRSCLLYGLVCSIIAGVLLFLFSGRIAERFMKIAGAQTALSHFAFSIPIVVAIAVLSGYFTACKQIKKLVAVEILDRVLSCILTVILLKAVVSKGITSAVTACVDAGTCSALICLLLLIILAKNVFSKPKQPESTSNYKTVIKTSLTLAVNDYLRSGLNTVEHFLIPIGLASYYGSAEKSLTQYGKIHGMVFPLIMFPAVVLQSLSELLIPELSRLSAQKKGIRTRILVKKSIRLGFFYSAAVSYLLFYLAPNLSVLVYDDISLSTLLRVFAPLVLILYADSVVDAMCKGLGKHIQCARINIFTSIIDCISLYFLLSEYGVFGYILTFAAVHLLNFYLSIRLLFKTVSWTPNLLPIIKTTLCVAACAVICLSVPKMLPQSVYCILFCLLFFALYVCFLRKLRVLRKTELSLR